MVFVPLGLLGGLVAAGVVAAAYAGSRTALLSYFVVLAFVTDAQFRARGAGEIEADWQSMLKFALWLGAGLIGAGHLPPLDRLLRHPGSALWLVYIVVALVSSLYSPVPFYTLGCSVALLCFYMFAYALARTLSLPAILWAFVGTMTVFNLASWVVFYQDPELGSSMAWTMDGVFFRMSGLAGQATNLGSICAKYLGALFLLWWSGRCRLVTASIFGALGVTTLLATDSRTMMVVVVLGAVGVVLSRSAWALAGGALVAILAFGVSLAFPQLLDGLSQKLSRSGDAAEIYTGNGRLEIWNFVWAKIMEAPVLGWGYNSSKVILAQYYGFENGLMVDSAHNMFLQSLLSVGFLGTLPLLLLLGWLAAKCLARPSPILAYFFIFVVIASLSDTGALGTTPTVLTLLFMLVSIPPFSEQHA
jgi:O-antigen ligase